MVDAQLGHPIRDDSFWLLVKLEKQLGRYDEAISFLNVLISEYPDGVLGDDALFLKAQILEEYLDKPFEAMRVYRQFLDDFPGSAFAVEARNRFRSLRTNVINEK